MPHQFARQYCCAAMEHNSNALLEQSAPLSVQQCYILTLGQAISSWRQTWETNSCARLLQYVSAGRRSKDVVLVTNLKDIWQKKVPGWWGSVSLTLRLEVFPLDSTSRRLAVSCFITAIRKEPETLKACFFPSRFITLRLHISSMHIKYNVLLDADVKVILWVGVLWS